MSETVKDIILLGVVLVTIAVAMVWYAYYLVNQEDKKKEGKH